VRKRCIAWAVLAVLLLPVAGAFAGTSSHGCTDHVCACLKHCPPKRTSPTPCHGEESAPSDEMYGRCGHPAPALVTTAAFVLPEVEGAPLVLDIATTEPAPAVLPLAGYQPTLLHPPRAV
jgi:hypothetical protein